MTSSPGDLVRAAVVITSLFFTANANVFQAQTVLGTSTDEQGIFRIMNPEVIAFGIDSFNHNLLAFSQDDISVENCALGSQVDMGFDEFSRDLRRDQGQYLICAHSEPLSTVREDSLHFQERNRESSYEQSLQYLPGPWNRTTSK